LTALIGLFAIPQLVENLGAADPGRRSRAPPLRLDGILPTLADIRRMRLPVGIGSVVGTLLGILPGVGGPIAAFISYDYAKKVAREPEGFGKGVVEGIAAPESANNAVTGGALVPMMTLGIPGDPVTAILIGALLVHGLVPGPLLFIERADFAYGVIFSFFWANIFNVIIAFAGLRLLVKLIAMPRAILMPTIALLCVVGSYTLRNSLFDVYVMFLFGLLGIGMKRIAMPVVPLLLALVLGRPLEEHLRIALTGSQGDVAVFFTSPFSALFLSLSAVSIAWPILSSRRSRLMRPVTPGPSK
jgi:putative tricarboxylic transport membrane protein